MVVDAGMISEANQTALQAAGLSFILGARIPYLPDVVREYGIRRRESTSVSDPSKRICGFGETILVRCPACECRAHIISQPAVAWDQCRWPDQTHRRRRGDASSNATGAPIWSASESLVGTGLCTHSYS